MNAANLAIEINSADPGETTPGHAILEPDATIAVYLRFLGKLQKAAKDAFGAQESSFAEFENRFQQLTTAISSGQKDCDRGLQTAHELGNEVSHTIEQLITELSSGVGQLRFDLDAKSDAIKTVLADLAKIGAQLNILAINATVEAAHAGAHGAGFAVVAEEVRSLSQQTMSQSEEAAKLIDLTEMEETMSGIDQKVRTATEFSRENTGRSIDSVQTAFKQLAQVFDLVAENVEVVGELKANTKIATSRAEQKIEWALNRTSQAVAGLDAPVGQSVENNLRNVLAQDGVNFDPEFDKLQAIRERGSLRVAIDPDFVGLSFRRNHGDALDGLDAQYALALASYIGVECTFVEAPWDTLTELLYVGRRPGEAPADIVISALPPNDAFEGVAYSNTYTWLPWVLARRKGDSSIRGLDDLEGKTLGIINDPGAFELLEGLGVRWQSNANKPGGRVRVANLVAYNDQSRIHDCLADGIVDAFGVDLPIYHWACTDRYSKWNGKIEVFTKNLASVPYYYAMGVSSEPSSYALLETANAFIKTFLETTERRSLENYWQGAVHSHSVSYRDEPGDLIGAPQLRQIWAAHRKRLQS